MLNPESNPIQCIRPSIPSPPHPDPQHSVPCSAAHLPGSFYDEGADAAPPTLLPRRLLTLSDDGTRVEYIQRFRAGEGIC